MVIESSQCQRQIARFCSTWTFYLGVVVLVGSFLSPTQRCFAQEVATHPVTTTSVAPPVSQTDWKQWIIDGASRSKYLNGRVEGTAPAAGLQSGSRLSQFAQTIQPLLENTCIDCHGEDTQEGNFRIDQLNPDLTEGSDVDWWVEVLAVVGNGEMPPPGEGDLSDEDRSRIVDWLSHEIQWASRARRAKGGHASFRRLTRYEYNYALQDLLGVPWNFAEDLPPEAHSADGFLNSSETLRMSVDQLETYRRLARTALRRVTVRGPRPEVLYWGISKQIEGSYGAAAKSMGMMSVIAQAICVLLSLLFMGMGAFSAIMDFTKVGA